MFSFPFLFDYFVVFLWFFSSESVCSTSTCFPSLLWYWFLISFCYDRRRDCLWFLVFFMFWDLFCGLTHVLSQRMHLWRMVVVCSVDICHICLACMMVTFSVSFLILCWSSEMFKVQYQSLQPITDLPFSVFNCVSFCFMYFGALLLRAYMFMIVLAMTDQTHNMLSVPCISLCLEDWLHCLILGQNASVHKPRSSTIPVSKKIGQELGRFDSILIQFDLQPEL